MDKVDIPNADQLPAPFFSLSKVNHQDLLQIIFLNFSRIRTKLIIRT